MFYVLTKKTNGEAIFRKRFRTVEYAEKYLAENFPNWEEKYNLEILYQFKRPTGRFFYAAKSILD